MREKLLTVIYWLSLLPSCRPRDEAEAIVRALLEPPPRPSGVFDVEQEKAANPRPDRTDV